MAAVTVILPVYNTAEYLRQCMDSIVTQTLEDLEIICVDDGSTDRSAEILLEYAQRDKRVSVIGQTNRGAGAARNTGLARATGEYLIFLDSDDWFEGAYLELALRKARETSADVTVCGAVEFDTATGRELPSDWMLDGCGMPADGFSPKDEAEHIFRFTHGWPWDKLYRTAYVKAKRLVFPEFRNSEDLVFVYESLALADTVAIFPQRMVHHRTRRSGSVSDGRSGDIEAPYQALLLLRERLREEKLYAIFAPAFLRWALGFLVWHVGYLSDAELRKRSFRRMRAQWLPSLGCWERPSIYSIDRLTRINYLAARYAPYPVFSIAMKLHQRRKHAHDALAAGDISGENS